MRITRKGPGRYHVDLPIWLHGKPTHRKRTFLAASRADLMAQIGEWAASLGGRSLTVQTVDKALDHYEAVQPASVLHNNRAYRRLLRARFGACTLDERLAAEWTTFVAERRKAGAGINHYAANLRAVLRSYMGTDAKLPISAWGIKATPARDTVLTEAQQELILQRAWANPRTRHLVAILEYNFMVPSRYSELEGARVEDMDEQRTRFCVSAHAMGRNKGSKTMLKPIPDSMWWHFGHVPEGCPWLFYRVKKSGECVRLGAIKTALHTVLRDCGLEGKWQFRDGRHMAATALANNGTPLEAIKQVAGWSTDMLGTYYHRDAEQALTLVKFDRQESQAESQRSTKAQGA